MMQQSSIHHLMSRDSTEYWHPDVTVDSALQFEVRRHHDKPADESIREAFFILENRIRRAGGIPRHVNGTALIDQAFHPSNGKLQALSQVGGEKTGIYELFLGIFQLYHTPISRAPAYPDAQTVWHILHLINHLLHIVDESAARSVDLSRFLGFHEGRVRHRRDFKLDLDNDGDLESLVLVDVSKTQKRGDDITDNQLVLIVIDEDNGHLRRVPAEKITAFTMDPAGRCELRKITSSDRMDLVSYWGAGDTGGQVYIHRWVNDQYRLVNQFERSAEDAASESSQGFYTHHTYRSIQFLDVDGDGLDEVIEQFAIFSATEFSSTRGLPSDWEFNNDHAVICKVWKWDEAEQGLITIDVVMK